MRSALLHPFAVGLLIGSVLLAAPTRLVPVLERWSPLAPWMILWGLLAYGAAVVVLRPWRPSPSETEPQIGGDSLQNTDAADADYPSSESSKAFRKVVETALKRVNNPVRLSRCQPIDHLPRTLATTESLCGAGEVIQATPLAQAQALREVLLAAMERLKPADTVPGTGTTQGLQYHILRERYVEQRPVPFSMTRHSISESTFHKRRREAIAALTLYLETQERLLPRRHEQV